VDTVSAGAQTLRLVDLEGNGVLQTALPSNAYVVGTVEGKVAL
jgi:hypothetical protein